MIQKILKNLREDCQRYGLDLPDYDKLETHIEKALNQAQKETIKSIETGKLQQCDCCAKVKDAKKYIMGTCEECF